MNFAIIMLLVAITGTIHGNPAQYPGNKSSERTDYDEGYLKPHKINLDLELKKFVLRLNWILEWYYEHYMYPLNAKGNSTRKDNFSDDDFEEMQGDQPEEDVPQTDLENNSTLYQNLSALVNASSRQEGKGKVTSEAEIQYLQEARERSKKLWVHMLKESILTKLGRSNESMPTTNGNEDQIQTVNLSQILPIPADDIDDDLIGEKIRSYFPSCQVPSNTEQDVWSDENAMNLYFDVEQISEPNTANVAMATLRLYRLPTPNVTVTNSSEKCNSTSSSSEDEKLLRVSIYWYTKSKKNRVVKKRLSDSKVIVESAPYVELSIRPAARAWSRGRNLGLAVFLEDQEGTTLRADRYIKGASCTQPQSLSQLSLSMPLEELIWNEAIARLEQIHQQPFITMAHCSLR